MAEITIGGCKELVQVQRGAVTMAGFNIHGGIEFVVIYIEFDGHSDGAVGTAIDQNHFWFGGGELWVHANRLVEKRGKVKRDLQQFSVFFQG